MNRYLDSVRKEIAKQTGLTGVEAGHIARQLERQGIDVQSIDLKTIGENMYGHGHRTEGFKSVVRGMYGLNVGESEGKSYKEYTEMEVRARQGARSPRSISRDEHINAHHIFNMNNERGVSLWMKRPNRYDILGIDDKY
jgi:hypothetical protein